MLTIVGCGRGTDDEGLTHDEVVAINERVLEKAISSPDSALMMIEGLRDTLPDYRCDYLRAKVYGQSLEGIWLDSAIIIGERLAGMSENSVTFELRSKIGCISEIQRKTSFPLVFRSICTIFAP